MEKETGRIEAFSDGIFAVAITLLALEIGIDVKEMQDGTITNKGLTDVLIALWPKIFAYFNSFAAVLLMWMAHHKIFKLLRTTNTFTTLMNGFLLLVIALVPFPTKTVGEFFYTNARITAVVFYTGYSVLISLCYYIFSLVILKDKSQLLKATDTGLFQKMSRGLLTGFLMNVVVFFIAFFCPYIAMALNFCMWIFWAFVSHRSEREEA